MRKSAIGFAGDVTSRLNAKQERAAKRSFAALVVGCVVCQEIQKPPLWVFEKRLAETQGFEPWNPRGLPVFKTGAIDHSAKFPHGELREWSAAGDRQLYAKSIGRCGLAVARKAPANSQRRVGSRSSLRRLWVKAPADSRMG